MITVGEGTGGGMFANPDRGRAHRRPPLWKRPAKEPARSYLAAPCALFSLAAAGPGGCAFNDSIFLFKAKTSIWVP